MKQNMIQVTPEKAIKHDIATSIVEQMKILFSAMSWKFFKEKGRGYLFFHKSIDVEHFAGNEFEVKKSVSPLENRILYVAKDSQIWRYARESEAAAGQSEEWADFYDLVDTYKPRDEFLVVVGLNEGDRSTEHWFYRQPEIPPHKAFLTVRKRPQEFGIEKL